jgi:hypothetical protein
MIPKSPFLATHELPDDEQRAASELGKGLLQIERHAKSFASAVSLFDLTKCHHDSRSHENLAWDWPFIAARGAVISLFNFDEAMLWVQTNLRHCPTIDNSIGPKALSTPRKALLRAHPNLKRMRDMVAHTSEMRLGETSVKHQGGPFTYDEALMGSSFVVTVDGTDMRLAMTDDTVQLVADTCQKIFDPFKTFDIHRRFDRRLPR